MNPRPFLDHLTATVELAAARSVLREVIALAEQANGLTNQQLRHRLTTLAECARSRSNAAHRSPAGRRPSGLPPARLATPR